MSQMQQASYVPERMHEFVSLAAKLASVQRQPVAITLADRSVSLALTGHPLKGCSGGLTNPVFRPAGMLG